MQHHAKLLRGASLKLHQSCFATGAGDDEDEVAVLSANDCLPAEGRGEVMSTSVVQRGMLKLTQVFSRDTATTQPCLCFHSCTQLH